MKRLVLIDSHAVIHRAFHALPPLTGPDGAPVNAVYGFASVLLKIIKDLKPDYIAAAFDHAGPTFRHLAYERYKATRIKAPDELYLQIPVVKNLLKDFGIPVIEKQGYEADDIIGTIAAEVDRRHPGTEIIIVTGDLDTLQLISKHIKVFTMRKGVSDTILYGESEVRARFGLSPAQLIDYKGLRGDPSDNIPGVKGIGEKTASELLMAHGSIEEIYRLLKKNQLRFKPGVIQALKEHEADALLSKTLATIDKNVPIKFVLDSARLRKSALKEKVRPAFEALGFHSLTRRLDSGGSGVLSEPAPSAPSIRTAGAVRSKIVKSFSLIPNGDYVVLLYDPAGIKIFAAAGADCVYELGAECLSDSKSRSWLAGERRLFVSDLKSLLDFGLIYNPSSVRDLAVMWWLLDPGRRFYTVEALIAKESGRPAPMDAREKTAALFEIAPRLEKNLLDQELWPVYEQLESPLTPILFRMEKTGIGFDARPLSRISKTISQEMAKLKKRIYDSSGSVFNINSPRQLGEVLFERMKLASKGVRKTEKSGVFSTRETELLKLKRAHPVIGDILRYREIAKLKSTYVDALPKIAGSDGRIHTTWNQTGTATGRMSSQNPNLQNIPIKSALGREIRHAFRAKKGFVLAAFDYSQIELRVAADLAGDEKMIMAFSEGLDIHRLTASEVNNIPIDQVTAELRYRAKALNFGVLYGMGARAFAESAGISRDEADHFIEEYFRDFLGLSRFLEATKEFAKANGFTKTAFGRKRFFPEITATNFRLRRVAERRAMNHPIQGTAADITKKAIIETDQLVKTRGWQDDVRILLQIHDELIFEIKKDVAAAAVPEIQSVMEKVWPGKVQMKVEVKQGSNWGELE